MSNPTITPLQKLTEVKYDRRARAWQVLNGKVTSFPAGPEGKRQAQLYALEYDRPDVAAELQAFLENIAASSLEMPLDVPGLTRRAIKGAFLIRDGQVLPAVPFTEPGGCMNEIARVQGSESLPYIITYEDDACFCDCPDFLLGDAPFLPTGQRACKHIFAVLITEALQLDAEKMEIDF